MYIIDDKVIEAEVFGEQFACSLKACKGACCVEGDAGAPLEPEETVLLEQEYAAIRPFLRPEGARAIRHQGTWVQADEDGLETPLVNGKECAYTVFEGGVACCGIEKAWSAGATSFRKPISCHLYPVRIHRKDQFEYLQYERWHICAAACSNGASKGVRVYEFVREALERKYGPEFYEMLRQLAHEVSP